MNYLTRPVFQFAVNWADTVNRAFSFDLREVSLGFGAEIFTGRGQYVVNGWTINVDLQTEQAIVDLDNFTAGRFGRLLGFWLPVPFVGCQIVGAVSATQFDIRDQNLRSSWQDSPDIHLYFEESGITQAAKITAVALVGSNERVTIDTALAPAPSVNTTINRLHYVRLADDVEKAGYVRELHQQRAIKLMELPQEYAAAETGERPIYFYHFWANAPIDYHWRYTSFAAAVISGNETFAAAAITHGQLRKSVQFEAEQVEIRAGFQSNHPLSLFVPIPHPRPINVEISQCSYATPDVVTSLFIGEVRKVNDQGTQITAIQDSFLGRLKQRIPAMLIKPDCSYQVFDVRTCKAVLAKFQASAFITAINNDAQPPTVEIRFRFPSAVREATDYFAQGWIETGLQLSYELRTVFSSVWDAFAERLTLALNAPLDHAIIGQEIQLIPGCDGLAATCKTKFNNFVHFPGFVDIPKDNPSFKAVDNKTSAGNKK